jgi:hypothetical protein
MLRGRENKKEQGLPKSLTVLSMKLWSAALCIYICTDVLFKYLSISSKECQSPWSTDTESWSKHECWQRAEDMGLKTTLTPGPIFLTQIDQFSIWFCNHNAFSLILTVSVCMFNLRIRDWHSLVLQSRQREESALVIYEGHCPRGKRQWSLGSWEDRQKVKKE